MSEQLVTANNSLPEMVNNQIKIQKTISKLESLSNEIADDMAVSIIEGWTTGDAFTDFVLVACNGIYDESILNKNYRRLKELGLMRPGEIIMVIQPAFYNSSLGPIFIRNIQLAKLRADTIKTNLDQLSIKIPVASGRLHLKELCSLDGTFASVIKIFYDNWLSTGPLYNRLCTDSRAKRDKNNLLHVPDFAVCTVLLLSEIDKDELYMEYGIDEKMLDTLTSRWISELTKKDS